MIWLETRKVPPKPDVELGSGKLTVSEKIAEKEYKQELDESSDSNGPLKENSKSKVWYVVIHVISGGESTISADGKSIAFNPTRVERTWLWAHTKSWARHLARLEQAKGNQVVDIFPGTKKHISHKYKGLK